MKPYFDTIPHTADVTLRIYGATQEELFSHAVIAMFASMEPQWNPNHSIIPRLINVSASDREALLVVFLSEALSLGYIHHEAYSQVSMVHYTETACSATLQGRAICGYQGPEIKAVTYHDIRIHHEHNGWQARVTFDI